MRTARAVPGEEADRSESERRLRGMFRETLSVNVARLPRGIEYESAWSALRRGGWVARLLSLGDPARVLRSVHGVLAALPPEDARIDRRRLASDVTGDPHALDEGLDARGPDARDPRCERGHPAAAAPARGVG